MAISSKALCLLLNLLEAREFKFTHEALCYHGSAGEELIRSKLLAPCGHDLAATLDEDENRPVAVAFEDRGLGYHDPASGWTSVDQATLRLFRPQIDRMFQMLLGGELRRHHAGLLEIEPAWIWELGSAYLIKSKPTSVWFARRLGCTESLERLVATLQRRPAGGLRLILTSTRNERLSATQLPGASIIPVHDVLSASTPAEIDVDILKARYTGKPADVISSPLHLSQDGRVLTIHGETVIRFRGDIQMKIVRLLVDAYHKGRGLRAEDLLTKSRSAAGSLDQAFGQKWKELKPFLKSEGGLWRHVI
jgi:hypothetical protein